MAYTAKPSSLPTWGAAAASSTVVGSLDIDTVEYQSLTGNGAKIRYTFNGSPDLSSVATTHDLTVSGSSNSVNDGTFRILAVSDASDYIDVYNPQRTSASDDEATDATGTGTVVQNAARIVTPTTGRQNTGWRSPEKPNDALDNWFKNTTYNWLNQYDQNTDGDYLIGRRLTAGSGISLTDNGDNTQLITASGTNFKTFSAAEDWSVASGLSGTNIAEIRIVTSSFTKGEIHIDIDGSTDTTLNPSGSFDNFITGITSSIDINCVNTFDNFNDADGYASDTYDYSGTDTGEQSGIWMSPDGDYLYIGCETFIHEFTTAAAHQLSGASFVSSNDFGGDFVKRGFCLNSTGTRVYVIDNSGPTLYEYPLSTPFTLSTIGSSTANFALTALSGSGDICLVNDTDFYYMSGGDVLRRITMSSASDLSTASNNGTYDTTSDGISSVAGVAALEDGSKIYLYDRNGRNIYEMDFGTAYTLSSLSYNSKLMSTSGEMTASAVGDRMSGLCLSGDANQTYLYTNDYTSDVFKYSRQETFSGTVTARVLYGVDG